MPDSAHLSPKKPCPVCGKPAAKRFRPFCSKRCADIDLHRWLSGSYSVPAVESGPADPVEIEEPNSDQSSPAKRR